MMTTMITVLATSVKHSVEAYDILDKNGEVLYDGDTVRVWWGGGNDGRPYRFWRIYRLSISKRGKLKYSGIENIVDPKDIYKLSSDQGAYNFAKQSNYERREYI